MRGPFAPGRAWLAFAFIGALAGASLVAGCSREGEDGAEAAVILDGGPSVARPASPLPAPLSLADASAVRDARADEELAAVADAGRFCGQNDLPDCPLQAWMKKNATTTLQFGETPVLGDVFDAIAALAPRGPSARQAYANWVSIARDGAQAARIGDVTAAKAACRGCHLQYRSRYHADLRGLPLPAGVQP